MMARRVAGAAPPAGAGPRTRCGAGTPNGVFPSPRDLTGSVPELARSMTFGVTRGVEWHTRHTSAPASRARIPAVIHCLGFAMKGVNKQSIYTGRGVGVIPPTAAGTARVDPCGQVTKQGNRCPKRAFSGKGERVAKNPDDGRRQAPRRGRGAEVASDPPPAREPGYRRGSFGV